MGRASIHGLKVNTPSAEAKSQNQIIQIFQLSVGNADAATDAGTAQTLSFHQHLDEFFMAGAGVFSYRRHQFIQNSFFIFSLQIDVDCFSVKNL